jgi:prepilin-type processing-associated H-X9-DG protein
MKHIQDSRQHGFTFFDFLTVLAALGLLVLVVPRLMYGARKGRCCRINCLSNQKQIGLAFRMWGNDNGDQFPMAVPFEKDGGREFALAGEPAPLFRLISKELQNAKVLCCPDDKERFGTNSFEGMTERNLSYLVGVDANEVRPQMILTADRNITIDGVQVGRGLVALVGTNLLGWSAAIHNQQGNVGLADGSAAQVNNTSVQRHAQGSGTRLNRFAVP